MLKRKVMFDREQITPAKGAAIGLAILAIVVAGAIIIASLSGPRRIEVDPPMEDGWRGGRGPTASPAAPKFETE